MSQTSAQNNGGFNSFWLNATQNPLFAQMWSSPLNHGKIPNPLNHMTAGGLDQYIDQKTLKLLSDQYLTKLQHEFSVWFDLSQVKPSVHLEKRFKGEAWTNNPSLLRIANVYCIYKHYITDLIEAVNLDETNHFRLRFLAAQWLEAISPANFLATNADAQQRFTETQGASLQKGFELFCEDVIKGRISQTDESNFEIGKNLAVTKGSVIYQDDLIELIQYSPSTPNVWENPILLVPPCINKFYILDLEPKQSFVKHAVDRGFSVFLISWRNVTTEQANVDWDDYVQAVLNAHQIVQNITQTTAVHQVGFCVGGTLLTSAAAVLAHQQRESEIASLTLLTTLLDFSHPGVLGIFADDKSMEWQGLMNRSNPNAHVIPARQLNGLFNALRPADLIWNYVESSYLKGIKPPAFDILYWNSDSTNLPSTMVASYLKNMYTENRLVQPNSFQCLGAPVDLSKINAPTYALAAKEDHIVPWQSAYDSWKTTLTPNNKTHSRFVLAASGHIAGVVNSPTTNRRSYWASDVALSKKSALPKQGSDWLEGAQEHAGSWWSDWYVWLEAQQSRLSKKQVKAPKTLGNKTYPTLREAPGEYVKARAM